MGGIGKTTLAGQLLMSLQPGFLGPACFLGNVRDEAGCAGGLLKLQRELLQALGGQASFLENADSGAHSRMHLLHVLIIKQVLAARSMPGRDASSPLVPAARSAACAKNGCALNSGREALAKHLGGDFRRKVLVVIDDADDAAQLNNLLPRCELHPESLIIVTSRKKHVLDARCANVSEVEPLPKERSVQLFRTWAFASGPSVWDTPKLVPELVACCGGLPLALKVGPACRLCN